MYYIWYSFHSGSIITIDCDSPFDEVTIPKTKIISPNYPNDYDNSKNCQTTIRFAVDQVVYITFEAFAVEAHSTCYFDYLEIHDGDTISSPILGSKLCGIGTHVGTTIQSTGNAMTILFSTDSSATEGGFKLVANAGKNSDLIAFQIYAKCFISWFNVLFLNFDDILHVSRCRRVHRWNP